MKIRELVYQNRDLVVSVLVLMLFIGIALLGDGLTSYTIKDKPGKPLQAPSDRFPLGTDPVGRCNLTVLIHGARSSLLIGLCSGVITVIMFGMPIGFLSGYIGGHIDDALMLFTDVFMSIPRIPFIIVIAGLLSSSLWNTIIVIGLTTWPSTARLIRSETLRIKKSGYVDASVGFGAGKLHLLVWHFLPTLTPLLISSLLMVTGSAIMAEAGLAFLGIGDPTTHSWGMSLRLLINRPTSYMTCAWMWRLLPQILAISGLLLALVSLGNSVERISGVSRRRKN